MTFTQSYEPLQVYGYHGTSLIAAQRIIEHGFDFSTNDYDWLGTGVYFFQDAPQRAYSWAIERYPESPAVIKSRLMLENCLDLLDIIWFPFIGEAYDLFVHSYQQTNIPLPRQNPQRSKAHRLDCAFFNYIVREIIEAQGHSVSSIRAVFNEGDRIYPNSAIFDRAHVQISIRNLAYIEESCLMEIE